MKLIGSPEAFEKAKTCGACSVRVIVEAGDLRIVRAHRTAPGRVQATCVCGADLDLGTSDQLPTDVVKLVEGKPNA